MKKMIKWSLGSLLLVAAVFLTFTYFLDADKPLSSDHFLVMGHRGACGYAPENTLPSFELAKKMKADYLELDLQMTKDGYLVVIHDETLDRTTNGKGWVKDHTLAEIKKLDAGSWFNQTYPEKANPQYKGVHIVTLDELFQHFGKTTNYYIEPKSPEYYPGMEEKVVKTLRKYQLIGKGAKAGQVILQSFSPISLKKIHRLDPAIPLIQLLDNKNKPPLADGQMKEVKTYAIGIGPDYTTIDPAFVQKARKNGLLVHVYTVNEEADMKRMMDWGVTGIFTNVPDRLKSLVKK